mgnify:FL=1
MYLVIPTLLNDAEQLQIKELLNTAMQWAKENGYTQVYLESMPELSKAVTIYENVGFKRIHQPLGNSGHCGCDIWMIKDL